MNIIELDDYIFIREGRVIVTPAFNSISHQLKYNTQNFPDVNHIVIRKKCVCCGEEFSITWRCNDRLCPQCSVKDYWKYYYKYKKILQEVNANKQIVLTVKNIDKLTKEDIQFLKNCCKEFRKNKFLKNKILGGMQVLELDFDERKGWHPHCHLQYAGEFIKQEIARGIWSDIVGYQSDIWVQQWDSTVKLLKYHLKFFKNPLKLNEQQKYEYNIALKSIRMIQTFGKLYRIKSYEIDKNVVENENDLCKKCRKSKHQTALS